jgi:uncharacterized protein DUF6178
MPQPPSGTKPNLTVVKGGVPDKREYLRLPAADKLALLRQLPAKRRLSLLTSDPEGKDLVRTLPPQELLWMLKETGAEDALELVEFSSPDQCMFLFDMELWQKWSLDQAKALEWLEFLLETGEERLVEQLAHLDFELLLLVFMREIAVGGGVGDLTSDEERTADYDHSFDNLYFISYRNPKNARLIGTLLDIIVRRDHSLYLGLMEGVKEEVETELEELAYSCRAGRLADLGFPEREEAVTIYARLDPSGFVPAMDKKLMPVGHDVSLPAIAGDDSLLIRALEQHGTPELFLELNYLINSALVAEETPFADREGMEAVFHRVYGYLTIALEHLCGNDTEQAAAVLAGEELKRLFRLGHGIVQGIRKRAALLHGEGHATVRALAGLTARLPRYYRGLDPDAMDAYREFQDLGDVRRMEEFLKRLEG